MTEQSPAVTAAHPPPALMRVVKPLLGILLKTPLAGPARQQMMIVNVKGRKSGRLYSIPLSAHVIGDALYALTDAKWKNDFRGGAPAEILHGAKRAQRSMGLKFRDGQVATVEQFTEAVDRLHIVAIRFTPA